MMAQFAHHRRIRCAAVRQDLCSVTLRQQGHRYWDKLIVCHEFGSNDASQREIGANCGIVCFESVRDFEINDAA